MERPKRKFVWVRSTLGHYDFLHPEKQQAFFLFHNLPDGLKASYVVDEKYLGLDEDLSPFGVAEELRDVISKFLYSSNKEPIGKVVEFLEGNQDVWLRESFAYEIELAIFEIAEWAKKKAEAEEGLAEMGKD